MSFLDQLQESPLYTADEAFRRRVDFRLKRERIFQNCSLFNFDVEITTDCNLRCKTCYMAAPEKKLNLTLDQFKLIMQSASEFTDHMGIDGIWLTMTGGEPLVNDNFIDMVKVAVEDVKGMALVTNGTLITQEMAENLESLNVSEVMISLDGATAETNDLIRGKGTFEKVLKAIRALQQTSIFTGATLTLTKYNIGEIEAYLDLCFNEGLHYAWINPPVYTGRLPEFEITVDYTQHVKMMKKVKLLDVKYFKYGFGVYYNVPYYSLTDPVSPLIDLNTACPWGRSNLTIKTDGSVLPCLYSRDLVLGNVFTDSLVDIFNHPILENFRNLSSLEEPCKSCQHLWFCGGCRARTFYLTGDWMACDPWCPLTRGVTEEDLKVTRGDLDAI